MPVRESCRGISQMQQLPEFESDEAYRKHLLFEQDLETYDKYYNKPPSSYPAGQKPRHSHMPPKVLPPFMAHPSKLFFTFCYIL